MGSMIYLYEKITRPQTIRILFKALTLTIHFEHNAIKSQNKTAQTTS